MFKLLFTCFYLISIILCTYRPMAIRNLTFVDDVCYYRDISSNSQIEYVKPCPSGKICKSLEQIFINTKTKTVTNTLSPEVQQIESNSYSSASNYLISTCQEYNYFYKTVGDECSKDFECDSTLVCLSNKCQFDISTKYDKYCGSGLILENRGSSSSPVCVAETSVNKDKCQVDEVDGSGATTTKYYYPGYLKICGEMDVQRQSAGSNYYITKTIKASFYGSVADGQFVKNKMACESGYALYFYGNKDIINPLGLSSTHEMFLLCVTPLGFDTDNKIIKYKIGNDGNIYYYNMNKIDDDYKIYFDDYEMLKLDLFQNYKNRFNQVKDECVNYYDINEPDTCRDNELRKWFYFYQNPEKYLLYKNDPDVLDYLIQQTFKQYLPVKNETTNYSGFINVKIFMILLLLILY